LVRVPEVREVERQYTVCVPAWREEQRQQTVLVPQTWEEVRQRVVTLFRQVAEQRQRQVVCYKQVQVPSCDPCTGLVGTLCQVVPQVQTVVETFLRCVPEERVENVKVRVHGYRPETRNVTVRVPTTYREVRSERVP